MHFLPVGIFGKIFENCVYFDVWHPVTLYQWCRSGARFLRGPGRLNLPGPEMKEGFLPGLRLVRHLFSGPGVILKFKLNYSKTLMYLF